MIFVRFSVRSIVVQCHIAQSVKFVIQCRQYGSALMGEGIVCRHFLYRYFSRKAERSRMAQVNVIGRITADLELKTSEKSNPYVRFDIAENIGSRQALHTQYFQVCAWGEDANRLMKAQAKKGSLIWVTGSLELEPYTKRDGISIDKRMKILLDNWGFVPVGRAGSSKQEPTPPESKIPPKQEYDGIDGERDALPG